MKHPGNKHHSKAQGYLRRAGYADGGTVADGPTVQQRLNSATQRQDRDDEADEDARRMTIVPGRARMADPMDARTLPRPGRPTRGI